MTSLRKLALAVALAAAIPSAALAQALRDGPLPPRAAAPRPGGLAARSRRASASCARSARELRALEDTRADFYARYAGRPGKVRKFERWYAERRAELEARRDALRHGYYASR